MLCHSIGLNAQPGLALRFRLQVREDMHARRVVPDEEWLPGFVLPVDEVLRGSEELFVDRFHSLCGERSRVLDLPVRERMQHAARTKLLLELGILRIVRALRFFLRIQVIEVAEKLVEAMVRRQKLVTVPQM